MQRVRLKDVDALDATAYVLPINPTSIEFIDNSPYKLIETVDGAPVRSVKSFDDRPRQMEWPSFPASHATFTTMMAVLKTYVGENKEIHLGDIDYGTFGWREIHIDDVDITISSGGIVRINMIVKFHYITSY